MLEKNYVLEWNGKKLELPESMTKPRLDFGTELKKHKRSGRKKGLRVGLPFPLYDTEEIRPGIVPDIFDYLRVGTDNTAATAIRPVEAMNIDATADVADGLIGLLTNARQGPAFPNQNFDWAGLIGAGLVGATAAVLRGLGR